MTTIAIETPLGPSRVTVHAAADPLAVLLLGHGAGGGINAFDLVTLADALPSRGVAVALHEQPWRVAGKRIGSRPPTLDQGWRPALDWAAGEYPGLPLWTGGRSAGARVACRCYDDRQAGVVCLAFPLHPPGKPERSRIDELLLPSVPRLVLQGDRDTFGTADDVRAALAAAPTADVRVTAVPGADHSMKVLKSSPVDATAVARRVVDEVRTFVESLG